MLKVNEALNNIFVNNLYCYSKGYLMLALRLGCYLGLEITSVVLFYSINL
jgi:hypothetical protein